MEFPSYPKFIVVLLTVALYLGVMVMLSAPLALAWYLYDHIHWK